MSRGTLTAIAGAAIGFAVGGVTGAKIGWTLGSFLGAESGPTQQGPRLNDLQAESLDYGADIPIVYGRARIAGFRMWQRNIREQSTKESGGKGGGGSSAETFTYYGTFAVALCEGPIAGVRKIWADSTLIYDAGDTATLETIQASNRAASGIRVYLGDGTQLPDSSIQATQGAANTPAFRSTAYILFDDLALEKFSNRIPNITAEVISAGTSGMRLVINDALPVSKGAAFTVTTPYWDHDNGYFYVFEGDWQNTYLSNTVYVYKRFSNGVRENVTSFTVTGSSSSYNPSFTYSTDGAYQVYGSGSIFTRSTFRLYHFTGGFFNQYSFISDSGSNVGNGLFCVYNNRIYALYISSSDGTSLEAGSLSAVMSGGAATPLTPLNSDSQDMKPYTVAHHIAVSGDLIYVLNNDNTIQIFDLLGALQNTISFSPSPSIAYGTNAFKEPHIRIKNGLIYVVGDAAIFSMDLDGGNLAYLGNPSIITGQNPYGFGGRDLNDGLFYQYEPNPTTGVGAGFRVFSLNSLSAGSVTLSSIASDITSRAGLSASDIDVTELTDTVDGYIVARNMSARSAIEPLQKAFLFDGAEVDGKIKFIKRGKASIATITQDDLGAGNSGSGQPQLTTTRQMDSELPSEVTVNYISSLRDYETGSEPSQRINYSVQNVVTQDLPIVMSADYAAKIADITHYNAWTEREKFNFTLNNDYIDLHPADVVTVQYGNQSRLVRLTQIGYGEWLECVAVSEDLTIYTSSATAADDSYGGQVVGLAGPTRVEYLDIPILNNSNNDAGLYYAVAGYFSSWTGAQIFKSLDGGITYNSLEANFSAATLGSTTTVLPTANPELWDRSSTLTVSLASGTLSSTTEDGAIQGSNYLLVGSEIINFVNATLNADGTYSLDMFLRGRRGTEWAVTSHVTGERVVFLSSSTIDRFEAIISTERTYKAVAIGTFIDEASEKAVTNTGVSLKPFSPCLISGSRDGSNNLTGTFTRRSRYITAPLWTPPVFEDSESYQVDIMSGATVLRTIPVSTGTFSYTAAQQTTDGLTPGSPVNVKAYQLSSIVGRGYALSATI